MRAAVAGAEEHILDSAEVDKEASAVAPAGLVSPATTVELE